MWIQWCTCSSIIWLNGCRSYWGLVVFCATKISLLIDVTSDVIYSSIVLSQWDVPSVHLSFQNTLSASTGVFSTCSTANKLSNGNPCRQVHQSSQPLPSLPRYERQWYNLGLSQAVLQVYSVPMILLATQHSNSTSHQLLKTPISTPSNQLLSREYTCEWMDRAWLGIPILEAELWTVRIGVTGYEKFRIVYNADKYAGMFSIGSQAFPFVSLRVDGEKSVINCQFGMYSCEVFTIFSSS